MTLFVLAQLLYISLHVEKNEKGTKIREKKPENWVSGFPIFKFVTFLVLEKTFRKIRNCPVISENQKSFRKVIVLNLLDFSHLLVVHDGVHVNQSIIFGNTKKSQLLKTIFCNTKGEYRRTSGIRVKFKTLPVFSFLFQSVARQSNQRRASRNFERTSWKVIVALKKAANIFSSFVSPCSILSVSLISTVSFRELFSTQLFLCHEAWTTFSMFSPLKRWLKDKIRSASASNIFMLYADTCNFLYGSIWSYDSVIQHFTDL